MSDRRSLLVNDPDRLLAPHTLTEAIAFAAGKAYVILDGTLLRIDRVGMTGGRDRPYYSGRHKVHGLNVQSPRRSRLGG